MRLNYIHDPMCSWCWAFRPVWKALRMQLPITMEVRYVLGGLAPDSHIPMTFAMQKQIQNHWHAIQKHVPDTKFNFEFWQQCVPRRSTYSACRAVIAAKYQDLSCEDRMIRAIQEAYYLQAQNPSDSEVLIACAGTLGLNTEQFQHDLNGRACKEQLMQEIRLAQTMNIRGFPSLVLEGDDGYLGIKIDYLDADKMLQQIDPKLKI